jgi:MATE family multidrug resistance protein
MRLALVVGLVATLVMFATPQLLALARIDGDVLHEARAYIYVRALGIVPFLLTIAQRSFLAAHHKTRPLIIAVAAGNVANAGLDLALIYGVDSLGIPRLGVIGAAAATTFVQLLTVLVYAVGVRDLYPDPAPRSTSADLRAIVRHGGPVGGQIFAEVGIFGVATILAAHIGKLAAAAHGIALNLASFTFSLAMGVASATSVRVGHAVGAGDLPLARRRGLHGLRVGMTVMAVFATLFLLVPASLASAFSGQAAVIAATVPLLQIAALFQLSDGAQAIAAGALRGLGHTRETLWGNLVGHYAIGLPISLALGFGVGLGTPGLWWGLSAGLTATAGYLVVAFMRGTRQS